MRTSVKVLLGIIGGSLLGLIGAFAVWHPWIAFLVGLSTLLVLPVLGLAGYYVFWAMVKADILWTSVEQGWCKIVFRWGHFQRIIGPGLHWIGIPGMYTLYKRRMVFMKSVTDDQGNAKAEPHDDKDISSFKTTKYPYGLPFKDEEDRHALPLSGILAVFAVIEDYQKAFFVVSDWYAEMNARITKVWRDLVATISYDDDIVVPTAKGHKTVSARFWEELNDKPSGGKSVLEELHDVAGINVLSVELVSIDPPPGWRDTTLAPYKAQKEKEAATQQAEASATLFGDTSQALAAWQKDHPYATQAQIEAKQEELRQRALAKTQGYQQVHIKGLEGATTAVVGGGGAGVMIGAGGKNPGNPGNPGGKGTANPPPDTPAAAADRYFKRHGKAPDWAPPGWKPPK